MRIFILTIWLLLVTSLSYAQDHWVYIRTYDRPTIDPAQIAEGTYGRSKKGDMVDIIPCTAQFDPKPNETQCKSYAIIKVSGLTKEDIEKYTQVWEEQIGIDEKGEPIYKKKADRLYNLDIVSLNLTNTGIYPATIKFNTIKNKIRQKTPQDLIAYLWGYRKYAYFDKPLKIVMNKIIPKAFAENVSIINTEVIGDDYETLTLWEDDKDGDLVTETRQETAHLYDDDGDLTDALTIDDSTTNATYYMKVTSPSAERHNGTATSGAEVKATTDEVITILDDFTIIEWLIVELIDNGTNYIDNVHAIQLTDATDCHIRNNVIFWSGSAGEGQDRWEGIILEHILSAVRNYYVYNNIVYGFYNGGIAGGEWHGINFSMGANVGTKTIYCYNNTVYGNEDTGIDFNMRSTNTIYNANNVCVGNGLDFDFTDLDANFLVNDYNCSEDATATGTNSITTGSDTDFESVTGGSEDFHLVTGAVEINEGDDLGTTPSGVEIDIDNRNRDAEGDTWDMGADEYVSGAPPAAGGHIIYLEVSSLYNIYKQFILALRSILC